ncbi:gamma-glutamyltransferase [Longimicrobium sp.]|uniref:gamma-glutamyltransferase n=1 Tax=Longimicrobium sp. TaxID=2029185 RepID=UPI002E3641FD|nr:gamma-glutamyltransferase [Longimicrobium sp.]HEX6037700.1 gamma-glutamyltransferase [Longimicrobium sp.]
MTRLRALSLLLLAALAPAAACGPTGAVRAHAAQADTVTFPLEWDFPRGAIAPVTASRGMVVTTDRVASEVGAEILRRNGNAVDAAVATHFALAVVNPEAGNIGGGGFLVVRMADGTTASLDFREMAPMAASADMFLDSAGNVSDTLSLQGHLASGVPGSVAGMWEAHKRFGSLPWADLLQPAIALAEGIVVHERLALSLRAYEERLARYPATARIFLPNGRPPRVGERLVQADLAETLRRIAEGGMDGFYRGRTAELVEAEMRRGGGIMTADDMGRYRAVWRDPLRFGYRGHEVISMPPPSSGGVTMAAMLKILEGYDLRSLGYLSPEHAHLFTEAARRAYADRNAYLADPDFVPQPTERMISDAYAAERRRTIDRNRATPSAQVNPGLGQVPGEGENTTHYSIVDARGNAVAVTTTINSLYGSLVTVDGAGFLLNNEMDDFTAKPGVPNQFGLVQGAANAVQPGKRMLSAMTPTIVLDPSGRVLLVTGTPGGSTIITSIAQIVSNVVDFRMDVATATSAPRLHHQHLPDTLRYERDGLTAATEARLRAMGHALAERGGYQGDVQSIVILPGGYQSAVADPRRGGAAVGVGEVRRVVQ